MNINYNDMLFAFSTALDCVERELIGISTNHGKIIAYLSVLIGRTMKLDDNTLLDLAGCAVLHDNALSEYIQTEYKNGFDVLQNPDTLDIGLHCTLGERNIHQITFTTDIEGAILYHHENADGSGPFGKHEHETPLFAQIIHMTDHLDAIWHFDDLSYEKFLDLRNYIIKHSGSLYSECCVEVFLSAITYDKLAAIHTHDIIELLKHELPSVNREYTNTEILSLCRLLANIIDYKSQFTMHHSLGVAQKAAQMGKYYGFDEDTITKLYLAGTVHDLGKLVVQNDILEKPSKLTNLEYKQIQNHAYYTYEILRHIRGFEEITTWASSHHEKLNGTGYPFGKAAEELGFHERLMACVDIYQALTEHRPYRGRLSHSLALKIMRQMVHKGFIDGIIVEDIHKVFQYT